MKDLRLKKGRKLEDLIAKFFAINGYKVNKNILLEGKSGGKHEIDVLAEKSDEITKIRIMVECKAWNKPIEKDVVSKVSFVKQDLGLDKAIIVSLAGWRVGAEKAAKEMGIELWGREHLEKILGKVTLLQLEEIEFTKTAVGFPLYVTLEEVKNKIEKKASGFFGLWKEEIEKISLIWIPCYIFELLFSKPEGFLSTTIKAVKRWNIYEALTGRCIYYSETEPVVQDISIQKTLQPLVKESHIKKEIEKTLKKFLEVVRYTSKEKYGMKLSKFCIPRDVVSVEIIKTKSVFRPFYAGILRKNDRRRVVAVDGVNGEIHEIMSDVLTMHLHELID